MLSCLTGAISTCPSEFLWGEQPEIFMTSHGLGHSSPLPLHWHCAVLCVIILALALHDSNRSLKYFSPKILFHSWASEAFQILTWHFPYSFQWNRKYLKKIWIHDNHIFFFYSTNSDWIDNTTFFIKTLRPFKLNHKYFF